MTQHLACCSLSLLWDQLKEDFQRDGFYREGATAEGGERQRGVVRTNCIDCLDRTNVVQGLLGRKHLEAVLDRAGLLDASDILALPNTFPQVCLPASLHIVLRNVSEHVFGCRSREQH